MVSSIQSKQTDEYSIYNVFYCWTANLPSWKSWSVYGIRSGDPLDALFFISVSRYMSPVVTVTASSSFISLLICSCMARNIPLWGLATPQGLKSPISAIFKVWVSLFFSTQFFIDSLIRPLLTFDDKSK